MIRKQIVEICAFVEINAFTTKPFENQKAHFLHTYYNKIFGIDEAVVNVDLLISSFVERFNVKTYFFVSKTKKGVHEQHEHEHIQQFLFISSLFHNFKYYRTCVKFDEIYFYVIKNKKPYEEPNP